MATYYRCGEGGYWLYRTREDAGRSGYKGDVIEIATDAEPIYQSAKHGSPFVVWSDGRVGRSQVAEVVDYDTPYPGKPGEILQVRNHSRAIEVNAGLSEGAVRLISLAVGADSGAPEWIGRVRDATIEEGASLAKSGGYQGLQVDRVTVAYSDGTTGVWHMLTEGYSEGYVCEFYRSRRAALDSRRRLDWKATECLECGAVYDESGYVEPGEMGCDRCNGAIPHGDWSRHLVR